MALDNPRYQLRTKTNGEFIVGELSLPFLLRRSARARTRITARLGSDGMLTITLPKRAGAEEVLAALCNKKRWLTELAYRLHQQEGVIKDIRDGRSILYLGELLEVVFLSGSSPACFLDNKGLTVTHPSNGHAAVLKQWLIQSAKDTINKRIRVHALKMGVSVRQVTLRDQKTRWGSCSTSGSISLNWRLVMAPPQVLDYVVIHELAHLQHMNHSKNFWSKVSQFFPDYKEARLWLKENAHLLRARTM